MTAPAHARPLGIGLALLASFALAIQAQFNGDFARLLDDALAAAWWGFLLGMVSLIVVVSIGFRAQAAALVHALRERHVPPWQLLGGVAGCYLIATQTATVALVGVALFSVLVVAGQTLMSLLVDKLGLAPGGPRPITTTRLLGAALTVVGVVLAVSGQTVLGFSLLAVLAILLAGFGLPFQQAFNAKVGVVAGSPIVAGLVNFVVGTITLSVALLVRWAITGQGLGTPVSPLDHPGPWSAGLIGVFFILTAALVVPWLGVLVFGLITIAGQLVAALVVDAMAGTPISPILLLGVLLCVVAVFVANGAVGQLRNGSSDSRR